MHDGGSEEMRGEVGGGDSGKRKSGGGSGAQSITLSLELEMRGQAHLPAE